MNLRKRKISSKLSGSGLEQPENVTVSLVLTRESFKETREIRLR